MGFALVLTLWLHGIPTVWQIPHIFAEEEDCNTSGIALTAQIQLKGWRRKRPWARLVIECREQTLRYS